MVRQILDPYSAFRADDFSAVVTEMGIKEFGKDNTPKAYIEFGDGGAPITYLIDIKGKSMVEPGENGRAKIKNFQLGAFVEQAKKFGLQTFVDDDPDNYEFGTIPDIVGKKTTWKAEKGNKRIAADGTEKEGFTNFTLVAVENIPAANGQAKTNLNKQETSVKTTKPGELDPALITAWKNNLTIILAAPATAGEIQKAINDMIKTATSDQKAILTRMSGIRPAALKALEAEKFLSKDADLKYSLVEVV